MADNKFRESGLDIIRCVAFLFVVLFHSFLYNGFYSRAQIGADMLASNFFRWMSCACIGLFLMITGYFKSAEPVTPRYFRSLAFAVTGYFAAATVSIPVRHFILGDTQSFEVWKERLLGFGGVYYGWYAEMYIGLILISTLINSALSNMNRKKLLVTAALMIAVTSLSGATPFTVFPDWWRSAYPITYYILGAAVRRLRPNIHPALSLIAAAFLALGMGIATVLSTDGSLDEALKWEFPDIWIMGIAFFIFLALYRVHIGNFPQKILKLAAFGTYGGYLLSHLFDASLYRLTAKWETAPTYPKIFFCITLPIYFLSLLSGWLLMKPIDILLRKIFRKHSS